MIFWFFPKASRKALIVLLACLAAVLVTVTWIGWKVTCLQVSLWASVKAGSSRGDVISFLENRSIAYYEEIGIPSDKFGRLRVVELAGVAPQRVGCYIAASIRQTTTKWVLTADVYMYFFFDPDGKLLDYYIRTVTVGL